MVFNYLKVIYRNLMRHKGYSFINISGLAVGLACFILISMWIIDEIGFDKFHTNIDRIYRVNTVTKSGKIIPNSSLRLGSELQSKYPDIEAYTNFIPWARSLLKYEDKIYDEQNIYLVDPAFFKMFSFEFIAGNPDNVLPDKFSIVITDETARKYFGNDDPMGKQVYSDVFDRTFKVTAVVKKMPSNSTLQFNIAGSVELMSQQRRESWEFSGWTYIMLKKNVPEESFNEKIKNFYTTYVDPEWSAYPRLQKYASLHLYESGEPGLVKLVYIFSAVAFFILIIAFANFTNLSTARATKRALEVGVRKVIGANKKQLVTQFIGESIIISFVSLLFAIAIVVLLLPNFNQFTGKSLSLIRGNLFADVTELLSLAIFSGVIAGSYPAFVLSSFKPASVLKGKSASNKIGLIFRRALTIGQFTISIGLIICTILVSQQMNYIQEIDLGMNREHIVTMANNPQLTKRFDTYKSELMQYPMVRNVSASATQPFDVGQNININWQGHMNEEPRNMQYTMVDYDFLSTLGMTLVHGRTFSKDFANDSTEACLINETAASIMGFENPIGRTLYFGHPAFPEEKRNLNIIGVVKDFHSRSLHNPIAPFVFKMYRPWHNYIFIKLNPGNIKSTIADIEIVTKKYAPEYPFKFEFLDDAYNNLYVMEQKTQSIFNVFAIIAIIVSCLGLFGLAAFTAEQKTKEVGIRKVLGASVTSITRMLSRQFAIWVLVANIIAWPVAYYVLNKWLQDFVYKIDITVWPFILAGIIAFLIAVLTISFQSIKAAIANPVESLKYE